MMRAESISRQFSVARQATADATQRLLVSVAKREHGKVMRTPPQPRSFTRTVDGVEGAREEAVEPDGVITYFYPRLDAVVQFALETLFDLSPVLSGAYRSSHQLFLGGVPAANMANWTPGTEILISNLQPYARKIDLGVMKMRVSGTARVYERAVRRVNARFGNSAKALYGWRSFGTARARGAAAKAELRYPVMIIRER